MSRRIPTGVNILAFLLLVSGIIGLCGPTFVLLDSSFIFTTLTGAIAVGAARIIAALLMMIGPVLQIAVALGALQLKRWAWWLGLVASGISLVTAVINIINGTTVWLPLLSAAVPLVILIYLLTPRVRNAFQI